MSLDELHEMQGKIRQAQEKCDALEKLIVKAKSEDPSKRVQRLMALARDQLEVTRFAVANLPPETTRGWPWERLIKIAKRIEDLPDFGEDDRSLMIELVTFANEAAAHEEARGKTKKEATE